MIRQTLSPKEHGIAQLHEFGFYRNTAAHAELAEHAHPDALEFCFLARGQQCYRLQDQNYELRGGECFLSLPNEIHDTGQRPEEKGELYWLIIACPPRGHILGLNTDLSSEIRLAIKTLPQRHFPAWKSCKHDLETLQQDLQKSLHDSWVRSQALIRLQMLLLRCCDASQQALQRFNSFADEQIAYIRAHLHRAIPLDELAHLAGLSLPRYKEKFRHTVGMPPGECLTRERIQQAQHLLSHSSRTILDIALSVGYSSSQAFATAFKRITGVTPRAWRDS